MRPEVAGLAAPAHLADQCLRIGGAGLPVAQHTVFADVQLVSIAASAKVHDMRALQTIGAPGAFGGQRVPACAVLILQGACGQGNGGHALLVLAVVIQAGAELPVKVALCMAFERCAMHGVRLAVVALAKRRGCQRIALAVDVDGAAVDGLAVWILEIALRSALGAVLPPAQGVAGAQRGRDVIGQLDFGVILLCAVLRASAEEVPGLVRSVQARDGSADRCTFCASGACRLQHKRKGQWLAVAVRMVEIDPERPGAASAADGGAAVPAAVVAAAAQNAAGLGRIARCRMGFEPVGHARHIVHHGTGRIAGVGRRERAVHHIHTLDFFGRHQPPARCVVAAVGNAIAQIVGQQNAIRINGRARAIARARGACGQDGVVVVADIALAHQQAGHVLEGIFAVRGVDAGLDFLARDALDGGWNLCGQ